MKNWAVLPAILYAFLLVLVNVPLYLHNTGGLKDFNKVEILLFLIGFTLLTQAILLMVPVKVGMKRFMAQRELKLFIFFAGFFVFLLVGMIILNIMLAVLGDAGLYGLIAIPTFMSVVWVIWGIIMFKYYKVKDQDTVFRKSIDLVYKGSIAQLLVAVPTHIICRNRDDCCATPVSMVGIITGVILLFFTFGPGALFLYKKRFRKKLRKDRPDNTVV